MFIFAFKKHQPIPKSSKKFTFNALIRNLSDHLNYSNMSQLFLTSSQVSDHEAPYQGKKNPISFTASTNQIPHLADVFSSISSINSQAMMIISAKGITIYTEYNHILNVQLTVDPALFTIYNFYSEAEGDIDEETGEEEELRLGVDISLIADSFNAATTSTSKLGGVGGVGSSTSTNNDNVICYITYNGEGHPLIIEFEDRLMSEKIEFLTFYLDIVYPYDTSDSQDPDNDNYGLTLNHSEIQFELILKSDVFANLLQDLSQINTVDLYIFVSNKWRKLGESSKSAHTRDNDTNNHKSYSFVDNQLNFISKGIIGHLKLLYPNNKAILEKLIIYGRKYTKDAMERAQLDDLGLEGFDENRMKPINASLITCYNFLNFIKIFKAVKLSTKCKIMKDLAGILSIQLLCKNARLANYPGTLITFNLLEISTMNSNYDDENDQTNLNLNNIFDDDFYEYIRDYSSTNKNDEPKNTNEYEKLNGIDFDDVQPVESVFIPPPQPLDTSTNKAPLTYASFKHSSNQSRKQSRKQTTNQTTNQNEVNANVQIGDSVYDKDDESTHYTNAKRSKKNNHSKKDQDDNNGGIETVGGAIEVPLFF